MPKRIKKRRKIESDDPDVDAGWEEYFDYIFPEDEGAKPNLKLLAMAKMWKKQKERGEEEEPLISRDEVKAEEDTSVEEKPPVVEVPDLKPSHEAAEPGENPDADDEGIRNEEDSSSEDEDDSPEPKRLKT